MEFNVEQVIHAAPAAVARIMFDPDLEDQWAGKAGKAERLTPGPMAVGSRVRHDAGALGLRAPFVTEVTELDPERRLAMEIVEGPVRGVIIYQVAPTSGGAIAAVHVRNPSKLPIPEVPWVRKHHVQENLHRLANLLTHSQ
jgi:hypothetical protein